MMNCCLVVCVFVKRCLIDAVERSRGCLYTTSRPACFQVFLDPGPFGKRTQGSPLNLPEMDTGRLNLVPSAPEQRKNGFRALWQKETPGLPLASNSTIGPDKRCSVFDTLLGHGGSDALIGQDYVFSLIPRLGTLSAIPHLRSPIHLAREHPFVTHASMTFLVGSMSRIGTRNLSRVST
jgi:hypothetical protein